MTTPPRTPSPSRALALAAAVVVVSVLLGGVARFGSIDWGLPYAFHPDEKGFVVWEAIGVEHRGLTTDDWRPRINTYGPLVYEVAIAIKWAVFGGPDSARPIAARRPDGWQYLIHEFDHLGEAPYQYPTWIRALRAFSAMLGTLSVLLLALAAWRLEGPRAGAFTAVITAACVGCIQVSHFFTSDALVVFELAMLVHACARLATGGGFGSAAYAGIALGTLAATKMPGLAAAPALLLAIGADDPFARGPSREAELGRIVRRAVRALVSPRFLVAVAVGVVVLRIVHPWLFTDPETYFSDVPQNRSGMWHIRVHLQETEFDFYDWRFTFNDTIPYLYHLTHPLPYAVGAPLLVASGVALATGAFALRPIDRIALVIAVPTLFLVGNWGVKTIRYVMPVVPGLLLIGGAALARWTAAPRAGPRQRHVVRRVLSYFVAAWTVAYGTAFALMFTEVDSRIAGARFVASHAEPGDVVVTMPESAYTTPLGTNEDIVGLEPRFRPDVRIRKLFATGPNGAQLRAHLEETFRGARFLVLDDFYLRRALHPAIDEKAPEHARFFRALLEGRTGFRRVATFRRRPTLGPLVWDESDDEILAVCFDHVGIEIWELDGGLDLSALDATATPRAPPRAR